MKRWMSLMQREWMQHRLGWMVAAFGPLVVMLVLASVGSIDLDGADTVKEARLPTALTMGAFGASLALTLAAVWITSLVLVAGMARRDHADRSIEFWLSMPVGHVPSVAAPLVTHLLVVPIAALGVGVLAGIPVSMALLARTVGLDTWLTLPWAGLMVSAGVVVARLALGIVLATLWLLPLILLVMLMTAWFKRWGLVILAAGVGLGSAVMDKYLGYPWISDAVQELLVRAGRSVINAGGQNLVIENSDEIGAVLAHIPHWAAADASLALGQLASPWLLGVLITSALLFVGLVDWRRRGASANS